MSLVRRDDKHVKITSLKQKHELRSTLYHSNNLTLLSTTVCYLSCVMSTVLMNKYNNNNNKNNKLVFIHTELHRHTIQLNCN